MPGAFYVLHFCGICSAMATLKEIKVRFTEEDIGIDKVAQSQGMSRSSTYVSSSRENFTMSALTDFHRLVALRIGLLVGAWIPAKLRVW